VCEANLPTDVSETAVGHIFTGHEKECIFGKSSVNSFRTPCKSPNTKKNYILSFLKYFCIIIA
jgi:hypothetical protein